jgi:hypothetical protein
MDCMILVAAVAMGLSLSGRLRRLDGLVVGLYLAALIAGPLILAGQWVRGRRILLSPGEWLWLASSGGVFGTLVFLFLQVAPYEVGASWIVWQTVASWVALLNFVIKVVFRKPPSAACRWTDLSGSLVGMAMFVVVVLVATR